MANPADVPGFGRSPARGAEGRSPRRSGPRPPQVATIATAAAALLVGFLLTAGWSAGRDAAGAQHERRAELVALIGDRQQHTEALRDQLEELRARVAAAEAELAAGVPALQEEVGQAERAAGVIPLTGQGLRVTLSDGPPDCSEHEENCRIHDSDLQLAVNELFAAGAEAAAVNGERIIVTTAIRGVGRTVQVNYRPLTGPYVIDVIGDGDRLVEAVTSSEFAELFALWQDLYGLGFDVEQRDEVEVPGYAGSVRLRQATPARSGSPR